MRTSASSNQNEEKANYCRKKESLGNSRGEGLLESIYSARPGKVAPAWIPGLLFHFLNLI